MRKLFSLFAAVPVLLSLLCCTREEVAPDASEEVLGASAPGDLPLTRSQVDADGKFAWDAQDKIAVHYTNAFPPYSNYRTATLREGEGTATAKFSLLPNGERDGYALYPAAIADKDYPGIGGRALRVHMPQSYPLGGTSMQWSAPLPMIAPNEPGQDLHFGHLGALMRLTLDNVPSGTQYIRIASDFNLSGSFEVLDLAGEPYIAADESDNAAGDFPFVVFSFPSPLSSVSSELVLNVPFPTGHYTNFTAVALDATQSELSCVNAGVDRVLARGKMRELKLDFSGTNRLCSFSASPLTLTLTASKDLTYELYQIRNGGGTEKALGYSISVDDVSNPDVAKFTVKGTTISIQGLSAGETRLRLKAVKGLDVIYATTTITVLDPILSIWSTSDKLFRGGTMRMRASVAYVGTDITSSSDLHYEWTLSEGSSLAEISPDGSYAYLTAGSDLGQVKVSCRISSNDPDGLLTSMEIDKSFTIIDPPAGTLPALFSISSSEMVYFARGNAYRQKSDGKYYLFEKQWDAYNGVVNQLPPEDADLMDCVDPMSVVSEFGDPTTSVPVVVDGSETSGWRLFTYDEINYLLNRRLSSPVGAADNARYVVAKVGGKAGIIIFPDEFIWPQQMVVPVDINLIRLHDNSYVRLDFPNSYTVNEWNTYLQPRGAVFLPGWIDAPGFLSKTRWDDSSIPNERKRNDTGVVNRPWNYYTSWYFCYYINGSYMQVDRPMNTMQIHITSPEYYPIDYVRYFHLRPIRDF